MTNENIPSENLRLNVEAISRMENSFLETRTDLEKFADAVARFCGSIHFLWVHLTWFTVWICLNAFPAIGVYRWDRPPFQKLTLLVALEAIFLSAFILITQNRQQQSANRRHHLDLQINLISEQKSTQILTMLQEIQEKLGIQVSSESTSFQTATDPEHVVELIEQSMALSPPQPLDESKTD